MGCFDCVGTWHHKTMYIQLYHTINCNLPSVFIVIKYKAISIKYCWCTALQVGRLRVLIPMVSLEFFIDIPLPAALWPWG